MERLFRLILAHPKLVLGAALTAAAVGWRTWISLPVDVFPEIREARVVIQAEAGGLTAEEVEQRIAVPVEAAMSGIPGVRKVRSSSGGGLAFVWVDFDWGADLMQARFGVFERLAAVREQLPPEVDAEIAPVVSITGEIMLVALTCPQGSVSPLELREIAEFDLRTRLMAVPGIGDVVVMGGLLPEYQIRYSPLKLAQYGLSVQDVLEAASASRTWDSGGYLPHFRGEEMPVCQIARADAPEALARLALPTRPDLPLRLGDVADVQLGGAPRRGSASFGGRDAVVLSVQKTPGGNTLELTRRLDAALDEFAAGHRAAGVEVHREAYRQADFIAMSIAEGRGIVRDAAIIVVLVLGLTLLKFRTILITLATMPLSVLAGVALFPCLGLGVNVMTLGGLAVGVGDIVDSAIILVEIVWRRLGENETLPAESRRPAPAVIAAAAREVAPSVLFSTLIIVLVFVPLLLLSGLESRFFAPLAQAYLLVFGASLAVAVTVVPALSALLWRPSRRAPEKSMPAGGSPATRALKAVYRPLLLLCLRFPKTLCLLMLLAMAGCGWLASGFGTSFIQQFREDAFTVFISAPPGTSLDESERIGDNAAAMIGRIPGVASVLRRTGRAERDQHAEPPSTSELVVRVDMHADAHRIRETIRAELGTVPGVSVMVGYPIAHRISAALSGTEAELAVNIFGEDLAELREVVKRVQAIMERLPVVADVRANREILTSTLRIDYLPEALAEADLTLQSAGEQVSAAFNGKTAGTVRQGLKSRDLVLRLDNGGKPLSPESVRSLPLVSPTGKIRRLDEVAHVYREDAPNLIVREQSRRKALITCNAADGSDTGTLVKTLREAIEPEIHAAGCSVSYGGSWEARQSAGRRLLLTGAALLAVIFMLLTFTLKTAGRAAIVMLNVPLSLMGGIVAVWLTEPVLSVASLVGLVTVAGFVIRNGILLVNRYRELEESGMPAREAIVEGSCERMAPILMTSLTTVLGLVPIVLAADKPGGEMLAPLAIVQFGGLVSATLLNMLVLPAVASMASSFGRRRAAVAPVAALALAAVLAGCRSYEPAPVDWNREHSDWRGIASVPIKTVREAEILALVANPEINRLRLSALRKSEEAKAAGWWEDPEINVDALRILRADEYPNIFGGSLAMTLPLSGVPGLERVAARQYAESARMELLAAERRLRTDVRLAAVRWAAAARREELLRDFRSDAAATNALARAARLAEIGEVEEAELSAARRRWHERFHALRDAETQTAAARLAFCRLLGVHPAVEIPLPEDVWREPPPPRIALPEELAEHELVRAALARLAGAETDFRAEVRRQYPDLTIGPAYEKEEGLDRIGLVAGLTLPLWNRNRLGIARGETERDLARMSAIEVWKGLVWDSVELARRYGRLAHHDDPEGMSRESADRLHAIGELSDVAYLAVRDELLETQLVELAWAEELRMTLGELAYFTVEAQRGNAQ